jgi:uncharacterized protein GlcG (DUF336 family)
MDEFLARAREVADAGLEFARAHSFAVAVVILDRTGTICAALRTDDTRTIAYEIAVAKALTAFQFREATASLKERISSENRVALAQLRPGLAFMGGGVPLYDSDGAVVGAVGVSGGTEQQDIECADACAR